MSYTTPVTDRTLSDITGMTTKGYFNVADWSRIYDNTLVLSTMLAAIGQPSTFTTISTVTTSSIPGVTDFNNLIGNIKNVQSIVEGFLVSPTGLETLKSDWLAGASEPTFNYVHVNSWEQNISILYQFISGLAILRKPRSGISTSGTSLTRNNRFRG